MQQVCIGGVDRVMLFGFKLITADARRALVGGVYRSRAGNTAAWAGHSLEQIAVALADLGKAGELGIYSAYNVIKRFAGQE